MLTILPLKDPVKQAKILQGHPKARLRGTILQMAEQGKQLGYAVVAKEGQSLLLYAMVLEEEMSLPTDMVQLYLDCLLRGAASYGEHHGADTLVATERDREDFFQREGMVKTEGGYTAPISRFVRWMKQAK